MFMLSILHILYMDPHVSKYIIYYFNNKSNSEVTIWNFIQIIYLYLSQYYKQDLRTWTVTWKVYDKYEKCNGKNNFFAASIYRSNPLQMWSTWSPEYNDVRHDIYYIKIHSRKIDHCCENHFPIQLYVYSVI